MSDAGLKSVQVLFCIVALVLVLKMDSDNYLSVTA